MSTVSYSNSNSQSATWSVESYEIEENDINEEIKKLDAHKLHRHDIISYKSSVGCDDRDIDDEDEDEDDDDNKSDITNPAVKRKLSRNLSQHLHWKKKSNKARILRNELEQEMECEEWILALATCKKILDLQAFNFEPLYHFYCGFIYETGFNNYESAERHYRVALQLEQSNDKHIRYYARILRRLERYQQAEHVYEYGLEQHPNNPFIRYEYSYLLWLSQKYPAALSQLKYCLNIDININSNTHSNGQCHGENVYWLYGRIQSELEQYSQSKKYLNHSIQLKPKDVGYRVDYILYLIHNKKYKEALKYYNIAYELLLNKYPEGDADADADAMDTDTMYTSFSYIYLQSVYGYLLSLQLGLKKMRVAKDIFTELLKHNKNNYFEIHFYYGLHLYHNRTDLSDLKKSLYQFISALIIEDNWAVTYYYIALVLYELAEYFSSLDFLNKAFKMNPSLPIICKNFIGQMSKIRKKIGDLEETEEDIHHFAVAQYKKRNWSLGCILFLRLLDMNQENTNYQHNLAMVLYYGFDNMEQSEKYFRKSLKSCGSSHPDIIRHYNVLLIKQERYEESNAYYQILFKICQKYKYKLSIDDHIQYANVTFHLKLYQISKEHLKLALKSKPNDGFIIGKYAVLLQAVGSFNLSFEYFKHSLSFIPNHIEIRYEFSNLLWRMQDYQNACKELKTCLNELNLNKSNNKSNKNHKLMEEKCCILYGIILIEIEEYDMAKQFILRAIELSRNDIRYIAELMLLFIKTKEFSDAYNYYEMAHGSSSSSSSSWYLDCIYAIYCSETNNISEANRVFNKLINSAENKTSPSYHIHFYYALHLHYKLNDYIGAKEQYISAISIEDYWGITYWHLHKLLFELNELKSALTFLKKAYESNKQIPCIHRNYKMQLKVIQNAINNQLHQLQLQRDEYESNKAQQSQLIQYQYKKRYDIDNNNNNEIKNALGSRKKTNRTKNKIKKIKKTVSRPRRKSNLYGSNSNLLDEESLDNLHRKIEKNKNKKKKKAKNKRKERKNKLTRDANKLYNDRYNNIYGIKIKKKIKKNKKKQQAPKKEKKRKSRPRRRRTSHSETTSITMISASEEYGNYHDHDPDHDVIKDDQSSTKSY